MPTALSVADAGELVAHTIATLKALGYASAAIIPGHQNPSNEVKKLETAPEYSAPGKQYADVRESVSHLISEMKNPQRDSYNAALDFTHASLAQMLDMLREPLYQHGLMLDQQLIKARDENSPTPLEMRTTFHHIPTGTEVHSYIPAFMKQDKRLDDCQIVGATFTYFRRYGLRGALNVTDGDDDADQADAKKLRRARRAKSTFRVCRETRSPRKTKDESILNVLVASGEIDAPMVIEQAKSRNPYLMTPDEVSASMIDGTMEFANDFESAKWVVLNYGLHDSFWHGFYTGYKVDGDELIDNKTDEHVTTEQAMEIVRSLTDYCLSSWSQEIEKIRKLQQAAMYLAAFGDKDFYIDDRPLTPEEERFVAVVEDGHVDEVYDICSGIYESYYKQGLKSEVVHTNAAFSKRVWFLACKRHYVNRLMECKDTERFLKMCEYTVAAFCPGVPVIEDMDQKACFALEIASGNTDSQTKLSQLNEIARRCDAYTKGYIDTLIMCVENDEPLGDLPPYIPESELPY